MHEEFKTSRRCAWHSAHDGKSIKKPTVLVCDKIQLTPGVRKAIRIAFTSVSQNLLIHNASGSLWKLSADGEHVEPTTPSEAISEDHLAELKTLVR